MIRDLPKELDGQIYRVNVDYTVYYLNLLIIWKVTMRTYAVIGLGYVGLGLAIALGKHHKVLGYDIDEQRVSELNHDLDRHQLINKKQLKQSNVFYTNHIDDIKEANFYIISVSTPAYYYETPNLEPLISAVKHLGPILKKGDIVVFESTVYPGTTEEICVPMLEETSHLKQGKDFYVGYSPERISPGDHTHSLKNITKIISAQNEATLKTIQNTYETICDRVYPVSSIQVAEAIKILENTQRDVNIAFMNEFSKIMHVLNLDTHEIIEGAKTKWSFLPFKPGFVGGHCISIDPHYLAFKAKRHGVQPDLILTARKINDGMTQFIIQSMLAILVKNKLDTRNLTVGILGLSYKQNTNDLRNSLSLKLTKELKEYGVNCVCHDPMDYALIPASYQLHFKDFNELDDLSVVIIAVGHDFYRNVGLKEILKTCKKPCVIMDIPNLFITEAKEIQDLIYWNL